MLFLRCEPLAPVPRDFEIGTVLRDPLVDFETVRHELFEIGGRC